MCQRTKIEPASLLPVSSCLPILSQLFRPFLGVKQVSPLRRGCGSERLPAGLLVPRTLLAATVVLGTALHCGRTPPPPPAEHDVRGLRRGSALTPGHQLLSLLSASFFIVQMLMGPKLVICSCVRVYVGGGDGEAEVWAPPLLFQPGSASLVCHTY